MPGRGNEKGMTVMGDALMDGLSDAGSTPARSTCKNRLNPVNSWIERFFLIEIFHKTTYTVFEKESSG